MGVVRWVMRGGIVGWGSVVLMRSRATAATSAVVIVVASSATRVVAMTMVASTHPRVPRHMDRWLQVIPVHRIIIFFFAVERNEFYGDEGGKQ